MDFRRFSLFFVVLFLATIALASAQTAFAAATDTPLVISRPLYVGSSGTDVSALQQYLKGLGYFAYPTITGYYGAATWQAVWDFQKANGLEPVGYVGPLTRALISA